MAESVAAAKSSGRGLILSALAPVCLRLERLGSRAVMRFARLGAVALAALALLAPDASAQAGSSGGYQTSVPLVIPTFRGLEPRLDLEYSSTGGTGWLGVGWRLSGLSEIRRTTFGRGAPRFDASDRYFLDGLELVRCTGTMTSPSCIYPAAPYDAYATRLETFQRVAFDPSGSGGEGTWYVWDAWGTKRTYRPRLVPSPMDQPVFGWQLAETLDTRGNRISYNYRATADARVTESYPVRIVYGATTITFHTEPRPDIITSGVGVGAGLLETRQRLKTIDVVSNGRRVRAYAFRYRVEPESSSRSILSEVQQYGSDAQLNAGTIVSGTRLPAIRFDRVRTAGAVTGAWNAASRSLGSWSPPWPSGSYGGGNWGQHRPDFARPEAEVAAVVQR
jgi:hypothetical protein